MRTLVPVSVLLSTLIAGCGRSGPSKVVEATATSPDGAPTSAPGVDSSTVPESAETLARTLLGPAPNLEALLPKLRAARDRAKGQERELLEQVIELAETVRAHPGDGRLVLSGTARVLRGLGALRPLDFELQLQVAASFLGLAATAQGMRENPVPFREEGLARAKAVVAKFPQEARAYAVFGRALRETGAPELESLRTFRQCLELEPTREACRKEYAEIAHQLERPRCSGGRIKAALSLVLAREEGSGPSHTWAGKALYLDPAPFAKASDLISVGLGEESLDGEKRPVLEVRLTSAGRDKLKAVTAAPRATQGWVALVVEREVVSAALFQGTLDSDVVILAGPAVTDLSALCASIEKQGVPKELQLPNASGSLPNSPR